MDKNTPKNTPSWDDDPSHQYQHHLEIDHKEFPVFTAPVGLRDNRSLLDGVLERTYSSLIWRKKIETETKVV